MEFNRTLVLLKSPKGKDENDPFVKKIHEAKMKASCLPVLSFTFSNLGELRSLLSQPEAYVGVVFTSQRAVEAAAKAISWDDERTEEMENDWKTHYRSLWSSRYCFCVGKATAEAAHKLGFHTTGEEAGSAEALVPEIAKRMGESAHLPLLYPCGNLRRDTLPTAAAEKGFHLKPVVCYKTAPDPHFSSKLRKYIESRGYPNYLVFYSPSGVQYSHQLIRVLQLSSAGTQFIAIGATTEKALVEHGLKVHCTAAHPTPEGLLDALKQGADR